MKRQAILYFTVISIVLGGSLPKVQADLYLDDGGIHTIDYAIDFVFVSGHSFHEDEPTTVNVVTGGAINLLATDTGGQVNVYDGSINEISNYMDSGGSLINVYGGTTNLIWTHGGSVHYNVTNVYEGLINHLNLHGHGPANIYGGSIGRLYIDGANTAYIYGGMIGTGGIIIVDNGTVNIYGGYILGDIQTLYEGAILNIYGGYISGDIQNYYDYYGGGILNIYGGVVDGDITFIESVINISGGLLGGSLYSGAYSDITIHGSGFNYPYGVLTGSGILTGTLANGDFINCPFNTYFDLEYSEANGRIVLVPVPGAALLGVIGLAVSGLKLRRKTV
jgi:hypothetical protein